MNSLEEGEDMSRYHKEESEVPRCHGVRLSWPWRGFPCGNDGLYIGNDGLPYCTVHLTVANNHPERFEAAIKAQGRRRK